MSLFVYDKIIVPFLGVFDGLFGSINPFSDTPPIPSKHLYPFTFGTAKYTSVLVIGAKVVFAYNFTGTILT